MRIHVWVLVVGLVIASFSLNLSVAVFADEPLAALQESEQPQTAQQQAAAEQLDAIVKLEAYGRFLPSSSVSAGQGSVTITEANTVASYEFKVRDTLPLKLSVEGRYIGIDNSTNVYLPAHLNAAIFDIETTLPFFGVSNVYLRLGVSPSFYGDNWDFESSDFRIPSRIYAAYVPNEQLRIFAGVAIFPEYDTVVLPILGLIYKPNDRLTFRISPERPEVTYALTDHLKLALEGGGYLNSEYEVDSGIGDQTVLQYKEVYVGTGLRCKLNKRIEASVSGGWVFGRMLRYEDERGKVVPESGPYTEFRVTLSL